MTPAPVVKTTIHLLTAAALAALAGCGQLGDPLEAMGARPPAPDEFKIVTRAPLVVPPGVQGKRAIALPRPQPGKPTPLEPNAREEAAVALLGPRAGATVSGAPSAGELVLVNAATEGAEADIREQLAADDVAAAREAENQPYQPPTVGQLLGFSDSDANAPDPETLVDPVEESQRLTRRGLRTPSDPNATAPDPEETAPREPLVKFDSATNRSVQRKAVIIE